jgi:tetratricopeptide (TPR) repeat protein
VGGGVPAMTRSGAAVAALLAPLLLLLCVRATAAQTTEDEARVRARELFDQGLAAFEAGDFPRARDAFQESFELRANATVLYNLANTQRVLGEYPASLASFRGYLELRGDRIEPETLARVQTWVDEMLGKVARITVDAPEGAVVSLDGRDVGTAPLAEPLVLTCEEHVLAATLPDHEPARETIRPAAGEQRAVRLAPEPVAIAPPPPVPPTIAPDVPVDVGVEAPAPEPWGMVPITLALGANLRGLDFEQRDFAENFFWSIGAGVQIVDWFGPALEIILPAVDLALWARFAFLRTGRVRLGATVGGVVTTGAESQRGAGFAVAGGVLAEVRLWEGLALYLYPTIGVDVMRVIFVAPLSLGLAYYV